MRSELTMQRWLHSEIFVETAISTANRILEPLVLGETGVPDFERFDAS